VPIWLKALLIQVYAWLGVALILWGAHRLHFPYSLPLALSFVALLASLFSHLGQLPIWWLPIQAGFTPALYGMLAWELPPWVYLLVLVLMWLFFRSNVTERVPLFLSNRAILEALRESLPETGPFRFVDLGCGPGGVLLHLAQARPDGQFVGVESALLPYLIARFRLAAYPNVRIRWGSFWEENLGEYDLVYAFLSPEPMSRLWLKVCKEMRGSSRFCSNSFEVPGFPPHAILEPPESQGKRLLIWNHPGFKPTNLPD
jgi:SAM-dependent methyltransferase